MKQSEARSRLKAASKAKKKAAKKLAAATAAECSAMLDAFESGIRRNEIETITKFSAPRVGQILRKEREDRYE